MRTCSVCLASLALLVVGILAGCSQTPTQSPDVSDAIRKSLDQAGLKDVSVAQDREKGVVTLAGHVAAEGDKSQAESIAKSVAGGQVVANQIAVVLTGAESDSKTVNADLDRGIEQNLYAALIQNKLHKSVKYAVKNAAVTLTGEVNTQAQRAMGRKGRVSSSKREAGGERAAGEEPEGHVVEGTVSSVHLLQREPSQ